MKNLIFTLAVSFLFTPMVSANDSLPIVNETYNIERDDIDSLRRRFRRIRVICIAENRRGREFRGKAYIWQGGKARRRALRKCRDRSFRPRTCYIVECYRTRHWF